MTSSLRERAAAAANPTTETTPADQPAPDDAPPAGPLEPIDAPEGQDDDPPVVPVHIAIARAMRDLGKIAKRDRYDGVGAKFDFRGVDRVVNAVAPVLRKHGLVVVPEVRTVDYRDVPREGGKRSHECVVTMAYHWHGPGGDVITSVVQGENLDTSDKSTAKAQSVAWRVCLIQMLAIPTGDPDPDSVHIERVEAPAPKAADYVSEVADHRTSPNRLRQIRGEVRRHNLSNVLVTNEVGDDEPLLEMIDRIGKARAQSGGQS